MVVSYFCMNDKMIPVFLVHTDMFSFQLAFCYGAKKEKSNHWHFKILPADSDAKESKCHLSFRLPHLLY